MPDQEWGPGRRIGRYRVVERIGRGGCGEVWRAFDTELERHVAIKVLLPDAGASEVERRRDRERFLVEARETARLGECPNIIAIYDYGGHESRPFLVMPLVAGRTLRDLIAAGPPMEPGRAVELVGQVAVALAHAHAAGRIHRDIKPSNVLVDESRPTPQVRVFDFGIVGMTDAAGRITRTGMVLGSLAYMAPERLPVELDRVPPGATVGFDVYALACLLQECLTGRPAFDAQAETEFALYIAYARAHRVPERPRPSWADASLAPFDTLVVQGLAVDPVARPGSAERFADDMRAALAQWTDQVRRPTTRTRTSYRTEQTRPVRDAATPTRPPRVPVGEPPQDDEPRDLPSAEWNARHGVVERGPTEDEPEDAPGEHAAGPDADPTAADLAGDTHDTPEEPGADAAPHTASAPDPAESETASSETASSETEEPPATGPPSTWRAMLMAGAGTGTAGCAVAATSGLGPVAGVVLIVASWAAGASAGHWISRRSR